MSNVLNEIPDDDAMLLMYIADELPAADAAAVERRINGDAALRDRVAVLRRQYEHVDSLMSRLTTSEQSDVRLIGAAQAGSRRVGRDLRQWIDQREMNRVADDARHSRWRIPAWVAPLGAVAAGVIGFVIWFGHLSNDNSAAHTKPQTIAALPDVARVLPPEQQRQARSQNPLRVARVLDFDAQPPQMQTSLTSFSPLQEPGNMTALENELDDVIQLRENLVMAVQ